MEAKKELNTTKVLVEKILAEDENSRNSDKYLTFKVIEEIAIQNKMGIYIPPELLPFLPAFESIRRVRCKIQNEEGKFLPTNKTKERRDDREGQHREWCVGK